MDPVDLERALVAEHAAELLGRILGAAGRCNIRSAWKQSPATLDLSYVELALTPGDIDLLVIYFGFERPREA